VTFIDSWSPYQLFSGVLKAFIRELKPPIIPYNFYLDFILVEGS